MKRKLLFFLTFFFAAKWWKNISFLTWSLCIGMWGKYMKCKTQINNGWRRQFSFEGVPEIPKYQAPCKNAYLAKKCVWGRWLIPRRCNPWINLVWNNSHVKNNSYWRYPYKIILLKYDVNLKTSTMEINFCKMTELKVRYYKKVFHHRRCFSNDLLSNFRTPSLWEHLWWLVL